MVRPLLTLSALMLVLVTLLNLKRTRTYVHLHASQEETLALAAAEQTFAFLAAKPFDVRIKDGIVTPSNQRVDLLTHPSAFGPARSLRAAPESLSGTILLTANQPNPGQPGWIQGEIELERALRSPLGIRPPGPQLGPRVAEVEGEQPRGFGATRPASDRRACTHVPGAR